MTHLFLISGFLGSGKTSMLKHILIKYGAMKRIAVIQNEFAPTGIDGNELQSEGVPFKLIEINNGSVFCVCMLGTFAQALHKLIQEHDPEWVFLEASGLSDPVNIIELLQDQKIREHITLGHIFTVVDAVNFEKGIRMLPRVTRQIMIADTILLNKTDLFDGDLHDIQRMLTELNPFAEVITTRFGSFDAGKYLSHEKRNHQAALQFEGKPSEGRPPIKVCVLKTHDRMSYNELESFMQGLNTICVRVKGYVYLDNGKLVALQSVFGSTEVKDIPSYKGPTEIVAFGEGVTPKKIRDIFRQHLSK